MGKVRPAKPWRVLENGSGRHDTATSFIGRELGLQGWLADKVFWMGGEQPGMNKTWLTSRNIEVIVPCANTDDKYEHPERDTNGREFIIRWIHIKSISERVRDLPKCVKAVISALSKGNSMYAHCNGGVHRAPIGFTALVVGLGSTKTPMEILKVLKAKRPAVWEDFFKPIPTGPNVKRQDKDLFNALEWVEGLENHTLPPERHRERSAPSRPASSHSSAPS